MAVFKQFFMQKRLQLPFSCFFRHFTPHFYILKRLFFNFSMYSNKFNSSFYILKPILRKDSM